MGIFNSLKEYFKYKSPVKLDVRASIFLDDDACVRIVRRGVRIEWDDKSIVIHNVNSIKKRLIKVLKDVAVEPENHAYYEEPIETLSNIELYVSVDSSTKLEIRKFAGGMYSLDLGTQYDVTINGIEKIKTALIEALESKEN